MQGPWPEVSQADVIIDGVPYMIDRLADIAWLRTAQFMAGIDLQSHVDLDARKDAMEKAGRAVQAEARKVFKAGIKKHGDKKGRAYTESAYSA